MNKQKLLITEYYIHKLEEKQDFLIIVEYCATRTMRILELSTKLMYDTTKTILDYQTTTAPVYVD